MTPSDVRLIFGGIEDIARLSEELSVRIGRVLERRGVVEGSGDDNGEHEDDGEESIGSVLCDLVGVYVHSFEFCDIYFLQPRLLSSMSTALPLRSRLARY